jgi:hypothetical protein
VTGWPEWLSIESAPKDGTEILVWDGETWYVVDWEIDNWFDGLDSLPRNPTHWMRLPPPPTTECEQ